MQLLSHAPPAPNSATLDDAPPYLWPDWTDWIFQSNHPSACPTYWSSHVIFTSQQSHALHVVRFFTGSSACSEPQAPVPEKVHQGGSTPGPRLPLVPQRGAVFIDGVLLFFPRGSIVKTLPTSLPEGFHLHCGLLFTLLAGFCAYHLPLLQLQRSSAFAASCIKPHEGFHLCCQPPVLMRSCCPPKRLSYLHCHAKQPHHLHNPTGVTNSSVLWYPGYSSEVSYSSGVLRLCCLSEVFHPSALPVFQLLCCLPEVSRSPVVPPGHLHRVSSFHVLQPLGHPPSVPSSPVLQLPEYPEVTFFLVFGFTALYF